MAGMRRYSERWQRGSRRDGDGAGGMVPVGCCRPPRGEGRHGPCRQGQSSHRNGIASSARMSPPGRTAWRTSSPPLGRFRLSSVLPSTLCAKHSRIGLRPAHLRGRHVVHEAQSCGRMGVRKAEPSHGGCARSDWRADVVPREGPPGTPLGARRPLDARQGQRTV